MEARTLTSLKGPLSTDRGCDPVGSLWDYHQLLPFSWADRLLGQDAHNQTKKARVSDFPGIKMGILMGFSLAGMLVLIT